MKTKLMVVVVTMLFALAMVAQTVTQLVPAAAAAGDIASACPCCSDKCPMGKDGKMADSRSCFREACCKDGKCDMAAHKANAMANGKLCCGEGCCKHGKCHMAAHKAGNANAAATKGNCCKSAAVASSCCMTGAACCKNGNLPCCDANRQAA